MTMPRASPASFFPKNQLNDGVGHRPRGTGAQAHNEEKHPEIVDRPAQAAEAEARNDQQGAGEENRLRIEPVDQPAAGDDLNGIPHQEGRKEGGNHGPAPAELLLYGFEEYAEGPEGFPEGERQAKTGPDDQPAAEPVLSRERPLRGGVEG
jgi:hypothetical protein